MYGELVLVWMLIYGTAAIITTDLKKGDSCITPYQETGTCIPIVRCAPLVEALASGTPKAFNFFKDSECGHGHGLVCCGTSNYDESRPTFTSLPPPQEEEIILSTVSDGTICGLDALPPFRIKGGAISGFKEYPWVAAIEYNSRVTNKNAGILCVGSLINQKFILTAAHCIVNVEFEVIKAWLGVTNITSKDNCLSLGGKVECVDSIRKVNVDKAIPHPNYNSLDRYNDIGLLRLENSIEFTDYIRPLCLPWEYSPPPNNGTYMTVAGWGTTENGTRSDIKLKVKLPIQNVDLCNKFLKSLDESTLSSEQLCVGGERGKDSCQGDAGGPLMKDFINKNGKSQWYQEGLVSYGVGCGVAGRPGVYTKVSSYVDWIISTINAPEISLARNDDCTTPSGKSGTCVSLNKCQDVFNVVATKNWTVHELAKKSYCGYDNEALVCCESESPIIEPDLKIEEALPDPAFCGRVMEEPRIIGGEVANFREFPWIVGIEYKSNETGENLGIKCAGSLINNQFVLTTAGCLVNRAYKMIPISVVLGEWQISSDPDCNKLSYSGECADTVMKVPIKETIPHIFYNGIHHDIGLILLEKQIPFTDYIKPICLPFRDKIIQSPKPGTRMTLVGWGTTESSKLYDILRKVEIPLISDEECNQKLNHSKRFIHVQKLCAGGERGRNTCNGDVGGPLIRTHEYKKYGSSQRFLEGMASTGRGCGREGLPAVYTPVAIYTDWIVNIISKT